MYAKIIEGKIKLCPINGRLSDGTAISNLENYFEEHPYIAEAEGWKKVIENSIPAHGKDEYVTVSYDEVDGEIVQNWIIKQL